MKNAQITSLVPLVLFSVLLGRVDDVGAQTMSRCLGIRIDAFLDFPVPDEDTLRELLAYDQQLCAILALPSATAQARRFASDGMEGWVAYRSICARGDVVQSFRNEVLGQIALAAERFCREVSATAPDQQRVVAGTAVVELGVEAFCLVVDNATDPGGIAALIGPEIRNLPSVVRLRAVGDSLCAGLRSRDLGTDDVRFRWNVEYERFRETLGPEATRYLLAKLWGIAKWVGGITVVLIGLIGTIVAILVRLKRLASHGKTDG